jgi:hypothetical protein
MNMRISGKSIGFAAVWDVVMALTVWAVKQRSIAFLMLQRGERV